VKRTTQTRPSPEQYSAYVALFDGYHNREWADRMEAIGLPSSSTGQPGGKRVGGRMSHYILEGGPFARAFAAMPRAYLMPWLSLDRFGRGPTPDPSKTPYTCPACEARVWGKPELVVMHIDCGMVMEPPKPVQRTEQGDG
jgi:hypothetical protein